MSILGIIGYVGCFSAYFVIGALTEKRKEKRNARRYQV